MFRLGLLAQNTVSYKDMVDAPETSLEVRQTRLCIAGIGQIADFSVDRGSTARQQISRHIVHAPLIAGDKENGRLGLFRIDAGSCARDCRSCSQDNDTQGKLLSHA